MNLRVLVGFLVQKMVKVGHVPFVFVRWSPTPFIPRCDYLAPSSGEHFVAVFIGLQGLTQVIAGVVLLASFASPALGWGFTAVIGETSSLPPPPPPPPSCCPAASSTSPATFAVATAAALQARRCGSALASCSWCRCSSAPATASQGLRWAACMASATTSSPPYMGSSPWPCSAASPVSGCRLGVAHATIWASFLCLLLLP